MFLSETLGVNRSSTTDGTIVTSGASNAEGSWVTIGTTTKDCNWLTVQVIDSDTAGTHALDFRVGGSTIVAEDILYRSKTTTLVHNQVYSFPIPYTASGTAIECRGAFSGGVTAECSVVVTCQRVPMINVGQYAYYGDAGDITSGKIVDPGATANTEGSVTELTTSSGVGFDVSYMLVQVHTPDASVAGNSRAVVKLYTGAAGGTATDIEVMHVFNSVDDYGGPGVVGFWVEPKEFVSGTRVWATCQSEDDTASDREVAVRILCFEYLQPADGAVLA